MSSIIEIKHAVAHMDDTSIELLRSGKAIASRELRAAFDLLVHLPNRRTVDIEVKSSAQDFSEKLRGAGPPPDGKSLCPTSKTRIGTKPCLGAPHHTIQVS